MKFLVIFYTRQFYRNRRKKKKERWEKLRKKESIKKVRNKKKERTKYEKERSNKEIKKKEKNNNKRNKITNKFWQFLNGNRNINAKTHPTPSTNTHMFRSCTQKSVENAMQEMNLDAGNCAHAYKGKHLKGTKVDKYIDEGTRSKEKRSEIKNKETSVNSD